nr:immunoglobulin light chain junction region [Macaca mulatta]MPN91018.1 immunoglobulin light chain junction region [Macaca mulatta]MPN91346.1 immunoglobulin light chain junction region [Macaca mulatta]MPN91426.1 immunoglobulin light chain junction region [Macaca mulatta]MPN91678.1 immunoglobulin light chain junction region [Macaca mulatta]
CHHYYSTPHSF